MSNRPLRIVLILLAAAFAGCGDSDNDTPRVDTGVPPTGNMDAGTALFACQEGRDGWQQCKDGKIQYCHLVSGMEPHFHWGTDCQALGLACANIDNQGQAACVNNSAACSAADEKCAGNTANFCVNGKLGQEPCGTAKECHAGVGEKPHCEEKGTECGGHGHLHGEECHCDTGYKVDPANPKACIDEVDFPTLACTQFVGAATAETVVDVFADFAKAHADLDKPYEVDLPDGKPSYLHFPVIATGEYVVFLSEAGVFDTLMHRTGKDVSPVPVGGAPNGKCATAIKDHWHASLTFDGAATDTKVPYIVRFKAITGGKKLVIMVKKAISASVSVTTSDAEAERLAIVDSVEAKASIFDVATMSNVGSFAIGGAAAVYAGPSGRFAYLVQGTANQVQILDSGLVLEDHGDHQHFERETPALLDYKLDGTKPVHFVKHGHLVTLFFDGLGSVQVLDERTLSTVPSVVTALTGQPHHGVALTFGDAIIATHPVLAEGGTTAQAAGIQLFSMAGVKQGEPVLGCPGLHGEASNATSVVFGCTDGALVLTQGTAGFTSLKISNPPLDPNATGTAPRVSTTLGHAKLPPSIGNFGSPALSKIDPAGTGTITPLPLPTALATAGFSSFALDYDGARVFVLGKDGALYAIDATTGAAIGTPLQVATFDAALPPKFTVGRKAVYVSDPKAGVIRKVDSSTLTILESYAVGGTPGNIAVLSFAEVH